MDNYNFEKHELFVNQISGLGRIQKWYDDDDTEQRLLTIYGRRRIGKTWLFKKFAHNKQAIVLVANKKSQEDQFKAFSELLYHFLPVKPRIDSLDDLFKVIYNIGQEEKILIVIDEFPYLLRNPRNFKEIDLTEIQSALENYRDGSNNKVIICGSFISQMEALIEEESPLYGRLLPYFMRPLNFTQAQSFDKYGLNNIEKIERFSVSGGLTKYIVDLNKEKDLKSILIQEALDPAGSLFTDPKETLKKRTKKS